MEKIFKVQNKKPVFKADGKDVKEESFFSFWLEETTATTATKRPETSSLAVASADFHSVEAGIYMWASHSWTPAHRGLCSVSVGTQKGNSGPSGVYLDWSTKITVNWHLLLSWKFGDSLGSTLEVTLLVILLEFQLLEFFLG